MQKRMTYIGVLVCLAAIGYAPSSSAVRENLVAAPTISSISPSSALPGATVDIMGTNFADATVTFTSRAASVVTTVPSEATVVSPDGTKIMVTVPDGSSLAGGQTVTPGANTITVMTAGGTVVASTPFTALVAKRVLVRPVLTAIAPHRARAGATVTLLGQHIGGALSVTLAGVKASFKIASDSKIVARVPAHGGSGQWSIKTTAGTAIGALRFVVIASR